MDAVVEGYGDVFAVADRLGFSGVELSLRRAELRSSGPESIRARARDRGLEIHALVLGEHNHGGIADADSQVAGAAFEDVRTAIAWAAELGAGVILVPFFMRGELEGDAGFARCVDAFASLCPEAADRGVTLCFEGLLPAREIRLLAERVESPAFGCYFDLANPLRRGLDSPTELRVLGELVKRVHVKDLRVAPGDVHPGLRTRRFRRVRTSSRRDRLRRLDHARDPARPAAARRPRPQLYVFDLPGDRARPRLAAVRCVLVRARVGRVGGARVGARPAPSRLRRARTRAPGGVPRPAGCRRIASVPARGRRHRGCGARGLPQPHRTGPDGPRREHRAPRPLPRARSASRHVDRRDRDRDKTRRG